MSAADVPHPPSIARVTMHRSSASKRIFLSATLIVLYALVCVPVYNTMGEPRQASLEKLKKLKTAEALTLVEVATPVETTTSSPAASTADSVTGEPNEWELAEKLHAEDEERQKKILEQEKKLPPWYLPNAWAAAGLFAVITSHILFFLLCHWLVWFKAATLFSATKNLVKGDWVLVRPHEHRGKASLEIVSQSLASGRLHFEFQHQRYEYLSPSLENEQEIVDLIQEGLVVGGTPDCGVVRLVKCPVDMPVKAYVSSKGLTGSNVGVATENFGKNILQVPEPKFMELYKRQLLSPLAIFQFFTSILWLLDEYWQYTVFSLFNVLVFESTTVFQQIKTRAALRGMATKPYNLHVFRDGTWKLLSNEDLLPGDLVSLKHHKSSDKDQDKKSSKQDDDKGSDSKAKAAPKPETQPAADVVPCDCVLLRGGAVVNEATLTGESVPQMKDALRIDTPNDATRRFEIEGVDRVHVLFSGTSLVSAMSGSANQESDQSIPPTPDGGCLCYVLRTGFNSSQGELMQMIEFSTQHVSADSKETGLALLLLLLVALMAAGYVLREGLRKGELTTHELLLKCVIIVTSVVPQQLPMQMALAVNTALMALMRVGMFCTEPYRVPFAGKITHCLFDKTGTLTTDQLVPVGVICAKEGPNETMQPVSEASPEAALVLAACHALVEIDGAGLVGDPIEVAGLNGVAWYYSSTTQIAKPGNVSILEKKIAGMKAEVGPMPEGKEKEELRNRAKQLEKELETVKRKAGKSPIHSAKILHRHHFSSKLQRMSVVCEVSGTPKEFSGKCCLVKGSPEAISTLLARDSQPEWFDSTYRHMAERGMRVLALALKWCPDTRDAAEQPREWVESNLQFVGFVAFACKTRADSPTVIGSLIESAHRVAMVTGDATLTALHVAKETGICRSDRDALVLSVDQNGGVNWVGAAGSAFGKIKIPFDGNKVKELEKQYELMTTETALEEAALTSGGEVVWKHVDAIKVFARMSPQGKAKVIRAIQAQGFHVLMCGDGGNDVGALKQGDVGLALLAGYGNANTSAIGSTDAQGKQGKGSEELLNKQTVEMKKKAEEATKLRNALIAQKQKELMSLKEQWMEEELQARRDKGQDTGFMAQMAATKAVVIRFKDEMSKASREISRKHGNIYAAEEEKDSLIGQLEEQMPVVRPGDASIAAPFTSRAPSIRSVVDLIRQGRCTMLSALQQQQIMMLDCMIYAFTLSALSLEGSRSSERQMMASGYLLSIASLAFSYSSPVERMDPTRPIKSLFHPAVFLSTLGQAAIHLYCMADAVRMATEAMGPEAMKELLEFNKSVKAGEDVSHLVDNSEDPLAEFWSMWSKPFKPNLFNTVVFLVQTSQMIAVLLVNYKGRPWMKGVLENHALSLSLFSCIAGVATCAWSLSPEFNALIHLAPFPSDEFRWRVMSLVLTTIVGTFIWDRLITMLFAREIFSAMWKETKATTLADLVPMFVTLMKVVAVLFLLGTGNPLFWIGGWWVYKKMKSATAATST